MDYPPRIRWIPDTGARFCFAVFAGISYKISSPAPKSVGRRKNDMKMMASILSEPTLKALIERSATLHAHRPALAFAEEEPLDYRSMYAQVQILARYMQDFGICHGDKVALLGENCPHWSIVYFAVTTIGAVIVPILPDFHASEIAHILRHSGSRLLFVSQRYYSKAEDIRLEALEGVVMLDDFTIIRLQDARSTLKHPAQQAKADACRILDIHTCEGGTPEVQVRPDDAASIIYTSGTTGHAKGVILSHRNIVSNALACAAVQKVTPEDRLVSMLPLPHVFECTVGMILPLMQGSCIYYLRRAPSAAVLLPALAAVRPTVMLAVPLIIEKVYKSRILPGIRKRFVTRQLFRLQGFRKRIHRLAGRKLKELFGGELRFFGIGGAPLSPVVERFLLEADFPYGIGYGLTEASPLVSACTPGRTRIRSAGTAVPGIEIRIADPNPATGIGEIEVRGSSVMLGYHEDPERTQEAFTADGWLRTGDLGRLDHDAYLYVTGRLKNVILGPSGENIYPEATESVINRSDVVLESLVYEDAGKLVARVHFDYQKLDEQFALEDLTESQARERIGQMLDQVKRDTNDQVSAFARISRVIEQVEPFEKTPTQKIKRHLYAAQKIEV